MKLWRIGPDEELMGYLGGDVGDNSGKNATAKNNNNKKWALKPSQELRSYLDGAGNVEPPPAEPNPEFGAKDYLKAFDEWNERKDGLYNGGIDVSKAYKMIGECSPLPKTEMEIQALLDLIPEDAADRAGVFISYLVNEVYQYDEIELRTNKPIGFLGTKNANKKLTIMGDVGDYVGTSMTGGGEIVIKGNAGNDIGWCMKGGKITVEGSAGWRVGNARRGGYIHLFGDYESIGDSYYDLWKTGGIGAVYHNGEQIY